MFYYHLTTKFRGPAVTFRPRVPEETSRMPGEDGQTARVCLAPTVVGCLRALQGMICRPEPLHVYAVPRRDIVVIRPRKSRTWPPDADPQDEHALVVPDQDLTGEIWCLHPVRLRYAGQLPWYGLEPNRHNLCVESDGTEEAETCYGLARRWQRQFVRRSRLVVGHDNGSRT